jgi:hypothetical protein
LVLLGIVTGLGACGEDSIVGPAAEACGPGPYFSTLPVPAVDLDAVPAFGGMDAPGHVLPTGHGGLFLTRADVPLRAPGDITITDLRRVRYSGPDVPPGEEDYAIFFQVCRGVTGWFGHVSTLASRFSPSSVEYGNCETYSVPWATVESCEARNLGIQVLEGDDLGGGGPVIDFGMLDDRVTNFYVSPHRFGGPNHAVCMWEQFDAAIQAFLFSKLRDPARPGITPVGEPRCGTMEVDVAGTAKGVWAEPGAGPIAGDERRYLALADYPYRPQMELVLSLGPESVGARLAVVGRASTGRVNRAFEEVGPDGLIYCYGPQVNGPSSSSWFVEVTSTTGLRIEHVAHPVGESPCDAAPESWSFGAAAVAMVR